MKTADEMFEDLGYKKEKGICEEYESYQKPEYDKHYLKMITFDTKSNLLNIHTENLICFNVTTILNTQELQAINKKCQEMGWIE